jgi:hypothetical protein
MQPLISWNIKCFLTRGRQRRLPEMNHEMHVAERQALPYFDGESVKLGSRFV